MANVHNITRTSAKPTKVKTLKPAAQARAKPVRLATRDPRRKRG